MRDQRGAAAVELVLVVPVLVLVLCTFKAGWRLWSARSEVAAAAGASARAATLESSASAARSRARAIADADLAALGVRCDPLVSDVDTSGFARPPGTEAVVTVRLQCRVQLADLLVPGLPGSVQVSQVGTHQMDTFRERRP